MPQFYTSFSYLYDFKCIVMAKNLLNKYVWLVETIYKAKRITFEEINARWQESDLSEGEDLPLRTFHKWRIAVEELFGLIIDCERRGGYHYYIENADDIKNGSLRSWLLNTISVSNLLIENQSLKDRILLESIPSGHEYLSLVIEAMRENKVLQLSYQSFWRSGSKEYVIEPYCVKLFKQRWYVVAYSQPYEKALIFALDRVLELKKTEIQYTMPKDFSAEAYFQDCFGIIADDGTKKEHIRLKVTGNQAKYFRSLPLHDSQKETLVAVDYSIFEYDLRPTFDFQQEILSHIPDVEVISPEGLRKNIAFKVSLMHNIYRD